MSKQTRRKFTGDFKSKVVLGALKERSSIEELARKYELHPTLRNIQRYLSYCIVHHLSLLKSVLLFWEL